MFELDTTLFKRLLKLYFCAFMIILPAVGFELFVHPGWEFSDEFDRLAAEYYRPLVSDDLWFPIAGVLTLVHLIGVFGLLRSRLWGRSLFVWPIVIVAIVDAAILARPVPLTPLLSLITFVSTGLFGAIVLLAYARDLGGTWLAQQAAAQAAPHPE